MCYFFDTLYLHINNELKLKIQFFNARQNLSVLKLTKLKIIQNEIGFIRLFNRESIEINFQSLHFSKYCCLVEDVKCSEFKIH
jgi:hypothetical protein